MIKSILGGKSKNLFDISKADVISREYYFTPNQGAGSNFYVMTVKPGITYTVTYERFIKSTDTDSHNALELSVQTGTHYKDGTQLLFRVGNGERGVWVKRSGQFTIPSDINQVTFSGLKDRFLYLNFMVQEGSTATEYVPHELTSYKSIMKVSDVCQLVDPKYIHTIADRGVTFTSNGDGSITVNGTPTGTYYSVGTIVLNIESIKPNHKYVVYDVNKDPSGSNIQNGSGVNSIKQKPDGETFSGLQKGATENNTTVEYNTDAAGQNSTILGGKNRAEAKRSTAIGGYNVAAGASSLATGEQTITEGRCSFSTGQRTRAKGGSSLAAGGYSLALGDFSMTQGYQTEASGRSAMATGAGTSAEGDAALSGGTGTKAIGNASVAFGNDTQSKGNYSAAFGSSTQANGVNSIISELIIANYQGGYIYKGIGNIFTFPEHPYTRFVFEVRVNLNQTANNMVVHPQFFDLTEIFGAGNEPKTVAEFKAKFPNDYYPYSPSCFVTSYDERMPCKTKNLFSSSTEVGTLEGGFGGPTVTRNFEENKWYQGFTTNGYYSPTTVLDFDIRPNSLYVYSKGAGYGMSRAIKCESNTDYFISCSYSHISGGEGNVYVGYFDEGGNFISNLNMDRKYKFVITTPSNCKWLIINFVTRGVGKVYFSDIQLVKGTTATDYVPYGYV